jgi:hypothetical protein
VVVASAARHSVHEAQNQHHRDRNGERHPQSDGRSE